MVNHARFLILPDVHIPNLPSKLLALNTRRLSSDWHAVYGHAVLAAETFVDPGRFAGTSHRAQGGQTMPALPFLLSWLTKGTLTKIDLHDWNWIGPGGLL